MNSVVPGIEVRPSRPDELAGVLEAAAVPFGFDVTDEFREGFVRYMDPATTICAFEGQAVVGTSGVFGYEVTVPGGARLPAGGITLATVLPTHRRRGVLSAMMRHQLHAARDRAEPLSALWASEDPIYGRFGYGEAVPGLRWSIERHRAGLRTGPTPGSVALIDRDEALRVFPAVHEEVCRRRHGMFSRSAGFWDDFVLWDPAEWRYGATARRYAVYREGPDVLGYVTFRTRGGDDGPGETVVGELHALTPEAYAGLWRFVLGIDLVAKISASNRPLDEPLRWMLADRWAFDAAPAHGLWIRLVDVAAALGARTYRVPGRVVVEVADEVCTWNAGRYEVVGGPAGSRCRPTADEPDLALDVAVLGAAYMGGRSLLELHDAGLVSGGEAAVSLAATMFSTDRPPWSPEAF